MMVGSRSLCCALALVWLSGFTIEAHADDAADFGPTAQALAQLIGCKTAVKSLDSTINVSKEAYDSYCRHLRPHVDRYLRRYRSDIQPVLAKEVPQTEVLPIVYPFGGGDLLTALGTFPNAQDITTLSLETSGDIRAVTGVHGAAIDAAFWQTGDNLRRLLSAEHSRTTNLSSMAKGLLPAELAFSLFALSLWGFEVEHLRYFDFDQAGGLLYLHAADIEAREKKLAANHATLSARAQAFPHVEIAFRRIGEKQLRVFRHVAGNLADQALKKDDRVMRHLRGKGNVFAMTKAASYLLWLDAFSLVRALLAESATFIISDSTGIPPHVAREHGFTSTTYGSFAGPFLPGANRKVAAEFIELWKVQPTRPIRFHYGYPDVQGNGHMVVMRREAKAP